MKSWNENERKFAVVCKNVIQYMPWQRKRATLVRLNSWAKQIHHSSAYRERIYGESGNAERAAQREFWNIKYDSYYVWEKIISI